MGRVQLLLVINPACQVGLGEEIYGVLVELLHPGVDTEVQEAERTGKMLRTPVLVNTILVFVEVI